MKSQFFSYFHQNKTFQKIFAASLKVTSSTTEVTNGNMFAVIVLRVKTKFLKKGLKYVKFQEMQLFDRIFLENVQTHVNR